LREISQILPVSMKSEATPILTFVHIFASVERLSLSLGDTARKFDLVSQFIQGFNSISSTMDFVDIGDSVSEKLSGMYSSSPSPMLQVRSELSFNSPLADL
jgi:hypothetical protein